MAALLPSNQRGQKGLFGEHIFK